MSGIWSLHTFSTSAGGTGTVVEIQARLAGILSVEALHFPQFPRMTSGDLAWALQDLTEATIRDKNKAPSSQGDEKKKDALQGTREL